MNEPYDPFIKLWQENFNANLEDKIFSKPQSRPLNFIKNTRPYSGLPVVLIVAGPSLDRNIAILKEYRDRCIIVCADVVLFKLRENDIKPDFVVNIDPHESIQRFWKSIDTSDLTFVCPVTTNNITLHSWNGRYLFFCPSDYPGKAKGEALKKISNAIGDFGTIFNRYFIGATMLQFAEFLNPKVVILMGYDFAFTDNKAYCDGFLDRKIINLGAPEGTPEHAEGIKTLKEREVVKEVQISFENGTFVYTTKLMQLYLNVFLELVRQYKHKVINSTEGGILLQIENRPLSRSLAMYCSQPIPKKDIFVIPKRKRGKRK